MNFKDPFPIEDVEYRIGATTQQGDKSMLLFYVDARAVMDRLDECSDGWRDEYVLHPDGKHVECRLTVTVDGVETTHADVGEPSEGLGDPLKGAYSDALKRAAVKFGIGRYLYSLGETWVPVETGANGKPRLVSASHEAAQNFYARKINGSDSSVAERFVAPPPARTNTAVMERPTTNGTVPNCPKCGGAVWDNRPKIASGQFTAKAPKFKCKDKKCDTPIWDVPVFDDDPGPSPDLDDLPYADADAGGRR